MTIVGEEKGNKELLVLQLRDKYDIIGENRFHYLLLPTFNVRSSVEQIIAARRVGCYFVPSSLQHYIIGMLSLPTVFRLVNERQLQ